jgi:hypothetical protein
MYGVAKSAYDQHMLSYQKYGWERAAPLILQLQALRGRGPVLQQYRHRITASTAFSTFSVHGAIDPFVDPYGTYYMVIYGDHTGSHGDETAIRSFASDVQCSAFVSGGVCVLRFTLDRDTKEGTSVDYDDFM